MRKPCPLGFKLLNICRYDRQYLLRLLFCFASLQNVALHAQSGAASITKAEGEAETSILNEVQRLRNESDINIVMDYDSHLQWNPLFSYTANEAQLHIALFEGLLSYDPVDMTPRPGLAKNWRRSADGLRYTFELRRDARFSNGELIDANTIAQTWFFLIQSGSKAPFSSLLDIIAGVKDYRNGKISQDATGIQVLDPYKLQLTLAHRAPEILAILCHHSLSPLPPAMLLESDWPSFYRQLQSSLIDSTEQGRPERLVGNGPYHLQYSSEAGIQLEANPYYWNADSVASKTIFIQKYYEWQDLDINSAMDSYKIDWIISGYSDFQQLRRSIDLVHVGKSFQTTFFYFTRITEPSSTPSSTPWSDVQVRQALTLLLPLEEMRQGLGGDAYLIPEMPNFNSGETLEKQNKEKAFDLLEKAGYPEGKDLGTLTLRFPAGASYEQFAELIRAAWAELKCEVQIQYRDPTPLMNDEDGVTEVETFTLGILSWIGDYPDPTTFLNLWRSDSSLNLFEFCDPEYDKILDQAQQTGERKRRLELLAKAEEYLLKNASVIPLRHSPSFNLYDQRSLDGLHQNVLDLHPLQTLRRIYRLPRGSA